MWTRTDLKARGKADFTRNYWACILISLIIAILAGSAGPKFTAKNSINYTHQNNYTYDSYDSSYGSSENQLQYALDRLFSSSAGSMFLAILAGFGILAALIGIAFSILVANPLTVGGRRFYLENQYEKGKISRIGYVFNKEYYGNTVLTIFLRNLFTFLWSLLLIVPGIIKGYSYWMIEYIMAENPSLSHERAFEISKRTMDGQKWDVFVLDLSFIPWLLLNLITCGLVGVFYVNSYIDATNAQLYGFLRMNALNQGFATPDELPGYYPQTPGGQTNYTSNY
ncbi:MAG: DUF975 family protein [Hespellia sp.]|nr:DUF975 family protein [Hespellia sp.]